ncbi:MAG: zinc ribbon domain-containing protein [Lachnospirales bacterium]
MDFFDGLGKKISGAADYMVNKTKSLTNSATTHSKNFNDISKLKSQKRIIEKNLTSYYYQLGKAYYENSGKNCEYIYSELVAVIDKENKNLSDLIEKIDLINGTKRCKSCGASLSSDSIFCNICGAKLEEQPKSEPVAEEDDNSEEVFEDVPEDIEVVPNLSNEDTNQVTTEENNKRVCKDCGFVLPDDAEFCTNCGKKYE